MKILHLDIETTPNLAHVWGLWKQNVGLNQLLSSTEVMCWVAKWHGWDDLIFDSVYQSGKTRMVLKMWELIDEADVVVHYNGTRFDIPHLNREFVEAGLTPPSSYKQIDLLQVVKKKFRFPSNKLEYVANKLGVGKKVKHIGHELWIRCMADDPEAWAMMEEYNKQDVVLLEELYNKLLPWVPNHPNFTLYAGVDEIICPKCGSYECVKKGYAYTGVSKFQQYKCKECGGWYRGRKNLASIKNIATNIAE